MFNYTRSDQMFKKPPVVPLPISSPPPAPAPPVPPVMPIEELESQPPIMPTEAVPTELVMQPSPQPTITCMYSNMGMQPPMPYMCPNVPICQNISVQGPQADLNKTQDDMEVAYLKKMYPPVCQKVQYYVENELNKYDHELSPIYEMYPAKESIDHMANCIYSDMKDDMYDMITEYEGTYKTRQPIGGSFYTLLYALLLNELYRRRSRRRLYPTPYSPFYNFY